MNRQEAAQEIRATAERLGLSLPSLARAIGVAPRTIQRAVKGDRLSPKTRQMLIPFSHAFYRAACESARRSVEAEKARKAQEEREKKIRHRELMREMRRGQIQHRQELAELKAANPGAMW